MQCGQSTCGPLDRSEHPTWTQASQQHQSRTEADNTHLHLAGPSHSGCWVSAARTVPKGRGSRTKVAPGRALVWPSRPGSRECPTRRTAAGQGVRGARGAPPGPEAGSGHSSSRPCAGGRGCSVLPCWGSQRGTTASGARDSSARGGRQGVRTGGALGSLTSTRSRGALAACPGAGWHLPPAAAWPGQRRGRQSWSTTQLHPQPG